MKVVTTEEMRRAEQAAVAAGISLEELMERAGRAVACELLARLGGPGGAQGRHVLALVGPGNNGGDALVAGRYLLESGLVVHAYLWKRGTGGDPLVDALEQRGGKVVRAEEDDTELNLLRRELGAVDAVIDGLLGMGIQRPLEGRLKEVVEQVNRLRAPLVIAVDLPTGVQADSGQVMGAAVSADVTVTMGFPKRGLYQFPGAGYAGEVVVADIGISESMLGNAPVELLDAARVCRLVPRRPRDAHKGTFGRLLVVAGSINYTGAPSLAAMAAYRVGAGLVTLAPPRSIYGVLAGRCMETTFLPLPEGEGGGIGVEAMKVIVDALPAYDAMVVGCGLGQEEETWSFVRRLLGVEEGRGQGKLGFLARESREERMWELPPLVLDADGLNALAGVEGWWRALRRGRVVVTPHPGEMARLVGKGTEEVLAARIELALRAACEWGQVVVLKGAHTVVAKPDGLVAVSPVATPALATAGTGDVLAGAIGGFLAQGCEPFEAAQLGVYVHARAGQLLEEEVGVAGGVAGDLLERLPRVLQELRVRAGPANCL
jgi:NAD(P)H-hydrate epimerase